MAKSLDYFVSREKPEVDWVWPGLLTRGNTMFILGQPKKAAKSWLILEACYSLSEGKPLWGVRGGAGGEFLFQPGKMMRSVYFTQEDTEDNIHDRVTAHFKTGRRPNDRLWVVPKNLNIGFDTDSGRLAMQKELDEVVEKAGPIDLVCFDPMRRMHRGDENDSVTIAKMWDVLDRIHRRYGCATLISHHTKKPPSDRANYDPSDPFEARGSGDIYGGGDAFVNVVPGKQTIDPPGRKIAVYFESKRGKPLQPALLKVSFSTGQVEWLGAGWEVGQNEGGRSPL